MWSPPDSIGCWSWYQPSRKPPGCRSWCLRACFGGQLVRLREAGADWYACYQETHNRDLFTRLRLEQDYDRRKRTRLEAAGCGLLAEDGLLTGVGESAEDLADSILDMAREPAGSGSGHELCAARIDVPIHSRGHA